MWAADDAARRREHTAGGSQAAAGGATSQGVCGRGDHAEQDAPPESDGFGAYDRDGGGPPGDGTGVHAAGESGGVVAGTRHPSQPRGPVVDCAPGQGTVTDGAAVVRMPMEGADADADDVGGGGGVGGHGNE